MIASIIVGLASIPFTASTVLEDYDTTIEGFGLEGNSSKVPQKFTRSMNSDSFEQTIQTAYGKVHVDVKPGRIYQKLTRPDMNVIVEKTPDHTTWELNSQNYELTIRETGVKSIERFSSPDGYLRKTKRMGNVTESVDGDIEKVRAQYSEARDKMQEAVNRMKEVKNSLPNQGEITSNVVINEFISNPSDGNFEMIELYNPTDSEVNLDGWTIQDNSSSTPESLTGILNPEEYMSLNVSDFEFQLNNNKGEIIILENSGGETIDSVVYEAEDGDVEAPNEGDSVGRCPDGSESWETFNQTSIGESNC